MEVGMEMDMDMEGQIDAMQGRSYNSHLFLGGIRGLSAWDANGRQTLKAAKGQAEWVGRKTGKRGNGKTGMGARALMYAKVFHVENPHLAAMQQPQQPEGMEMEKSFILQTHFNLIYS